MDEPARKTLFGDGQNMAMPKRGETIGLTWILLPE